jgi:hypothetical protein
MLRSSRVRDEEVHPMSFGVPERRTAADPTPVRRLPSGRRYTTLLIWQLQRDLTRPHRTFVGSNRARILPQQIRQVRIADRIRNARRRSIRRPIDVRTERQQFAHDTALTLRDGPHEWRHQHGTATRQRVSSPAAMS